jgi:predicted transposase YdaD
MHEYDVAFKLLLQQSVDVAIREIAGTTVARWLSVELPEVRNTRVDLLGESTAGDLIHLELQSTNDPTMALRMAEYCLRVYRLFGRFPQQTLVYVGDAPLRMQAELRGPTLQYSYRIVDIRDLDGERLLTSPNISDNIIAILTRLPDIRASVHRIVERIAGLDPGRREEALRQLIILAGLRTLAPLVDEEAQHMPILNDIRDHEVLGPLIIEGERKGERKGELKGELKVLRRLIEKRFGTIPAEAEQRLSKMTVDELDALSDRVLDARNLEELLT